MGYYRGAGDCVYGRGDYYRGDYYRGDPFSLKSVFGGIVGGVKGFFTGGPVGAITGAIGGATGKAVVATQGSIPKPPIIAPPPAGVGIGYFGPSGGGVGVGYFPESGGGVPSPQVPMVMNQAGQLCPMKGVHPNKSTYVTRGGGTSRWPQELIVHPKGTECVRTRRMNVCNPTALRRALRRAAGFSKLAKRFVSLTTRHHYKAKALPRRRRK